MKFYWNNLAWLDTLGVPPVITAVNDDVYFPANNLASYLACDVARSALGHDFNLTLTATFANPTEMLLYGVKANSGDTVVVTAVQAGFSSTVINLVWTGQQTLKADLSVCPHPITAIQIQFPRNTGTTYGELSKVFIGTPFNTGGGGDPIYGAMSHEFGEYVNKDISALGQKFSEARATYFAATLGVPYTSETVQTTIRSIVQTLGTFTPFWILVISDTVSMPFTAYQFCSMKSTSKEQLVSFGDSYLWGMNYDLIQQL